MSLDEFEEIEPTTTDELTRDRLLGPKQVLLTACCSAVESRSFDDLDALMKTWTPVLADRHQAAGAISLVTFARSLVSGDASSRAAALARWRTSGLVESDAEGVAAVLERQLRREAVTVDAVSVPVLFDRGPVGDVGLLTVSLLRAGPPGFHPDPSVMFTTDLDGAVQSGAEAAWRATRRTADGRCLLWSVTRVGLPLYEITGGSMAAAMAIGIGELGRSRMARRVRPLDRTVAVSATLDGERLGAVGGLGRKLAEAEVEQLSVVLGPGSKAEVDRIQEMGDRVRLPDRISYAPSLRAANELVRRRASRVLKVAMVLALVLALVAPGLWLVGERRAARDERRLDRVSLLRKVDELRRVADGTDSGGPADLRLQSLLRLAASTLAKEAGEDALARDVLLDATEQRAGRKGTVPLTFGQVSQVLAAGDWVFVGSALGDVGVVDPATGNVVASYQEGPGAASLIQPVLVAAADHPSERIVALALDSSRGRRELAIFDVPSDVGMSRGDKLEEIGVATVDAEISALAYREQGDRLASVSGNALTFWDVSFSAPSQLETCRLPDAGEGGYVQLLTEDDEDRLTLVGADGRAYRTSGWSAPDGRPCDVETVVPAVAGGTASDARLDADGRLQVATATGSSLVVRTEGTNDPPAVTTDEAADQVEFASADLVAVSAPDADQIALYDTASGNRLRRYTGYGDAFAAAGGELFASADGSRVDQLSTETLLFPSGLNVPLQGTPEIVAGTRSFAIAQGSQIGVYPLDGRGAATWIVLEDGLEVGRLGFRINSLLDLADDDRTLAAIVSNGEDIESNALALWDVESGRPIEVPLPDVRPNDRFINTAITVAGSGSGFVVTYLLGDIVRVSRSGGLWRSEVVFAGGDQEMAWAPALDGTTLWYLRFEPEIGEDPAGRGTTIDRVSLTTGRRLDRWDLGPLDLALQQPGDEAKLASVLPTGGGAALLITDGGEVRQLRPKGRFGPERSRFDSLGTVSTSVVLPGGRFVLGGRNGSIEANITTLDKREGTSRFGPLDQVDRTSDGRFLIGGTAIFGRFSIVPLRPDDQVAGLCASVGEDISEREWQTYVGSLAPWRPLCPSSLETAKVTVHAVREVSSARPPFGPRTPTRAEVATLAARCRTPDARTNGRLGWSVPAPAAADGPRAVVCMDEEVRWVIPDDAVGADADESTVRVIPGRDHDDRAVVAVAITATFDGEARTALTVLGEAGPVLSLVRGEMTLPARFDRTLSFVAVSGAIKVGLIYDSDRANGLWGVGSTQPLGPSS